MKLFLFDIDRTLVFANPYSGPALTGAFRDLYKVDNILDKVPHAGTTDIKIAKDAIALATGRPATENEISDFLNLFVEYLSRDSDFLPAPEVLPGVCEILEYLSMHSSNILGLQTGNLEVSAWMKLEKCGLAHYFQTGGFASDSEHRAELVRIAFERHQQIHENKIKPENVYLIGDTPFDITAGTENGFKTIAVASGIYSSAELSEHKPHAVFENMHLVHQALREMIITAP